VLSVKGRTGNAEKAINYIGKLYAIEHKAEENKLTHKELSEERLKHAKPILDEFKNWLFSGHPRGAKASAALYSLIETAKANDLEPYSYLRFLFDRLPHAKSEGEYKVLLPNRVSKEQLNRGF